MGVQGLSTYLRENKRHLARTFELKVGQHSTSRPIVVDGWSFLYNIQQNSNLPWVYGGEYPVMMQLVCDVVNHLLAVGLDVHFVFDGAYPELKFATLKSRAAQHIQSSVLFFRTSPTSRSTTRFLREAQILPPMAYSACVQALLSLSALKERLTVYFADEEGDPYSVELAGRIGACILGMDSDFVVLNSTGYQGYIPLDEMIWILDSTVDISSLDDQDGGFKTVKTSKKKVAEQMQTGRGIIPPETSDTSVLTLSFPVYKPSSLAEHLRIPVTLLPLLGAIVGNDFSKQTISTSRNIQNMFFVRELTSSKRIDHAATTLRSVLSTLNKNPARPKVTGVIDLIDKTVRELLSRFIHLMSSGEVEEVIEKIVEATLQYAIPPKVDSLIPQDTTSQTSLCVLHPGNTCPIIPLFSRLLSEALEEQEMGMRLTLSQAYIAAYRRGQLHPRIMDVLHTGTFWARIMLENPDVQSFARVMGRPIRLWIYAILDNAVGLPETLAEPIEESSSDQEDDESESDQDELVDVVEEDSSEDEDDDLLAPLRGALQRLHTPDGPPESSETSSTSLKRSPKFVTEYIRRGVRIADEMVTVPPLTELLSSIGIPDFEPFDSMPLALHPEELRLEVFLKALASNMESIKQLPKDDIMAVVVIRWAIRTTYNANLSSDKLKERWTRVEAMSFLASLTLPPDSKAESSLDPPLVSDRAVQLTAQILSATEAIEQLSQALLLTDRVSCPISRFSAEKCHHRLSSAQYLCDNTRVSSLWDICKDGLEDSLREYWKAGEKKKKKHEHKQASVGGKVANSSKRGLFDVLGNVSI